MNWLNDHFDSWLKFHAWMNVHLRTSADHLTFWTEARYTLIFTIDSSSVVQLVVLHDSIATLEGILLLRSFHWWLWTWTASCAFYFRWTSGSLCLYLESHFAPALAQVEAGCWICSRQFLAFADILRRLVCPWMCLWARVLEFIDFVVEAFQSAGFGIGAFEMAPVDFEGRIWCLLLAFSAPEVLCNGLGNRLVHGAELASHQTLFMGSWKLPLTWVALPPCNSSVKPIVPKAASPPLAWPAPKFLRPPDLDVPLIHSAQSLYRQVYPVEFACVI